MVVHGNGLQSDRAEVNDAVLDGEIVWVDDCGSTQIEKTFATLLETVLPIGPWPLLYIGPSRRDYTRVVPCIGQN